MSSSLGLRRSMRKSFGIPSQKFEPNDFPKNSKPKSVASLTNAPVKTSSTITPNALNLKKLGPLDLTPALLTLKPRDSPLVSKGVSNHVLAVKTPDNATTKSILRDDKARSKSELIMSKIQRDFNSPSAAAHVRAKRALKSPCYRNQMYGRFDVPHEMQELITEEERKPMKIKTIAEIFAKCKIFVEVRTGDDNRSDGIKNRLLRDGIRVNDKLYKDTTHVIFKDGLLSTYKNAIKMGIPVTTILWLDACIAQKRLVDTDKFKISNIDRYERPELYKRIRRPKSIQPKIGVYSSPVVMTPTVKERTVTQNDSNDWYNHCVNETIDDVHESTKSDEMNLSDAMQNASCMSPAPMECSTPKADNDMTKKNRRFTRLTPTLMEQTEIASKTTCDLRRTIFSSQLSQKERETDVLASENGFSNNSGKTIVFNSQNRVGKTSRRSVLDISLNLLELNCKALNEDQNVVHDLNSESGAPDPKESISTKENLGTQTKQVVVRKRRLFNNESFEGSFVDKENLNKSVTKTQLPIKKTFEKSFKTSYKTTQLLKQPHPKIERRKTMSYFKTEKPIAAATVKSKTPTKSSLATKYVVCTNMSQTDKIIIQDAILKLGGKVDAEVTPRTTHVVSPNEERTMNILRGVIRACVIVNIDWIHDSMSKEDWLDTAIYQHSICDTNRVYQRSILGTKNFKNLTFANHGLIYLNKQSIDNPKKVGYLEEIISLCNGILTDNRAEAKFIVTDKPLKTDDPKQICVISTYIFDSAMRGTFLDVIRYQPKVDQA